MSRVFIPHRPQRRDPDSGEYRDVHDLSPAMSFGQLVTIYDSPLPILSQEPLLREMRRMLKDFSDDDHIIALGDPVAIMMAGIIASEANRGRVSLLKWDRVKRRYIRVLFNIHNTEN